MFNFLSKFIPAVKYSLIDETCRYNHAKFLSWLVWFVKESVKDRVLIKFPSRGKVDGPKGGKWTAPKVVPRTFEECPV